MNAKELGFEIRNLASATLGKLFGTRCLHEIDACLWAWLEWIEAAGTEYDSWKHAWEAYSTHPHCGREIENGVSRSIE
jgi:hypothetical protein